MTARHFPLYGRAHLEIRFRLAFGFQAAGDLFEFGHWQPARGAQQDPIACLFDDKFRARGPCVGIPYLLGVLQGAAALAVSPE
jgi:hypothetical protein